MHPTTCKHFNSIAICGAGVVYARLPVLPCWRESLSNEERLAICSSFVLPTREEVAAHDAQIAEDIHAWLAKKSEEGG